MKWTNLSPYDVVPGCFGFTPHAVKVARYNGTGDVRCFRLRGWQTFADLTDHDPRNGKTLRTSEWFVFAAR